MSSIDKALKRLDAQEQAAVRKFWAVQKEVYREERELKRRNILLKRY
jgi:uncharacterized protein YjaG (DUF416 family)